MRIVPVFLTLVLAGAVALAQQNVPPPPQPPADKPAAQNPPADNGPSLEVTMKYIQDKVNQQGNIAYIESISNTLTGENIPPVQTSVKSQVLAIDPTGVLSLQESSVFSWPGGSISQTNSWHVSFKDVEKLEVLNSADWDRMKAQKSGRPQYVYQDDPPLYELIVHFVAGKSVRRHIQTVNSSKRGTTESDDSIQEFALHFRDEDTADRVAKAFVHAIELCGGGSKPELF